MLNMQEHVKGSNAKCDKHQIYTCFFFAETPLHLACTSWQNFTSQNEINCSQNPFQSLGFNTKRHKRDCLHGLSWKFDKMDISSFALKPFMCSCTHSWCSCQQTSTDLSKSFCSSTASYSRYHTFYPTRIALILIAANKSERTSMIPW